MNALLIIGLVLGTCVLVLVLRGISSRREQMLLWKFNPVPPTSQEQPPSALAIWLLEQAEHQINLPLAADVLVRQRIAQAALKAMTDLQQLEQTTVDLPFLTADSNGPRHVRLDVSRADLQRLGL